LRREAFLDRLVVRRDQRSDAAHLGRLSPTCAVIDFAKPGPGPT
jgi:hypothetical protein